MMALTALIRPSTKSVNNAGAASKLQVQLTHGDVSIWPDSIKPMILGKSEEQAFREARRLSSRRWNSASFNGIGSEVMPT